MPSRTTLVEQRRRRARHRYPLQEVPAAPTEPTVPGCASTPAAVVSVPATSHAAALARTFAQTHLCREHARGSFADVTVVVSELVTRALLGGAQPITVKLSCTGSATTISVSDVAPAEEEHGEPQPDARLLVAARVAVDWGREGSDGEPMVWCTVAASDLAPRDAPAGRPARTRVAPPWA